MGIFFFGGVFEVLFATSDFCFSFVYILFAALYIGNGSCSMYTGHIEVLPIICFNMFGHGFALCTNVIFFENVH